MSWGDGATAYETAQSRTLMRRISALGVKQYRVVDTTSWVKTCMSKTSAFALTPTAVNEGTIVNINKDRVDESDQWHVSWDEKTIGEWTDGEWPT